MRIGNVKSNIAFKRALNPDELKEYGRVLRQAREHISDGGKSIFIVHEPCLPQAAATDTGIGHLTSKSSGEFFDFIKNYMGINTVEVLPPGEIQLKGQKGFYNSYNGSALSLGSQGIDLELLTKPEFNGILPEHDFQKVVSANAATQKAGLANFENVVGKSSAQEDALQKAYLNFIKNDSIDKTAYEKFKMQNSEWLERKAIYAALKEKNGGTSWTEWPEIEKNLFVSQNGKTQDHIAMLKSKYSGEMEFYKFKQFMAEEHLKLGRTRLNQKGMKLFGDCLIGFSEDEVWAFRDAFKKDAKGNIVNVGLPEWHLPALNYAEIQKEGSAAQKLLRMKVGLFARRYDGIRFDCSWAYVDPKLSDGSKFELKGSVLDIIEDTVKKVKGKEFNPNDLIHEFEADGKDFSIFDETGNIKSYLRNRVKVISSAHMSDKYGSAAFMRKLGANPDSYIVGVGNHDPQPLRQIAEDVPEMIKGKKSLRRAGQAEALRNIFGVSYGDISSPSDFAKFKFAEPLSAKNSMIFYMDAFGRAERFDSQLGNGWINYRYRIPVDYQRQYNEALKSGFGFNPMDGYAKVFRQKGLDVTQNALYKRIVHFADILSDKASETVEIVKQEVVKQTKKTGSNKWLKVGGIGAAVVLIAAVISAANNGLKKQ